MRKPVVNPVPRVDHVESPRESELAVARGVELEAFAHWLDTELDQLVARWVHLAAPNASRPREAGSRIA